MLTHIESGTPGYYHADSTTLRPLDRVQERLCRELGITAERALEHFKLAPLMSRRDMAMLGLLHRIILIDAPPVLVALFRFADPRPAEASAPRRYSPWLLHRHKKQLKEQTINTDILRRSLFGLTYIYNLLPQSTIDLSSVRQFQSALQRALRSTTSLRLPNWEYLFSHRLRPVRDVHFQRYFDS